MFQLAMFDYQVKPWFFAMWFHGKMTWALGHQHPCHGGCWHGMAQGHRGSCEDQFWFLNSMNTQSHSPRIVWFFSLQMLVHPVPTPKWCSKFKKQRTQTKKSLNIWPYHSSKPCSKPFLTNKLMNIHLVGGFNPSEKYYIVNWDHYSQYTEK